MSKNPIEFIKHIKDEYLYILSVTDTELTYDSFSENETLKRAVVRSL